MPAGDAIIIPGAPAAGPQGEVSSGGPGEAPAGAADSPEEEAISAVEERAGIGKIDLGHR